MRNVLPLGFPGFWESAARAGGARRVVVVTDGVFSMDGFLAPLDEICDLAEEFGALPEPDRGSRDGPSCRAEGSSRPIRAAISSPDRMG